MSLNELGKNILILILNKLEIYDQFKIIFSSKNFIYLFECLNFIPHDIVYYASLYGNLNIVKYLENQGHITNYNDCLACACSSLGKDFELVKYLVDCGANVQFNDSEALYNACIIGDLKIVEFLLECGSDPNSRNNSPIINACSYGYIDIVKLLIKYESIIPDNLPLEHACSYGYIDIVKLLFETIIFTKDSINTACYYAIMPGHYDIVIELIKNGADINDHSYNLINAVRTGNLKLVKLLIDNNFDYNVSCDYLTDYLTEAINNNHVDIVKYFVDLGIYDCEKINNDVYLYYSCKNNNEILIKYFIELGSDINCHNSYPLFVAINTGNLSLLHYLIENGADIISYGYEDINNTSNPKKLDMIKILSEYGYIK
ncbi:ankyrin repeat protein [Cotonvirus japonicus]|uniref:Ankyrin repeat protein n=1 Tax=Cotonvirus japonicus TaxID=2811091 RepID=A0ABM7NQV0_9VIRU|nr:ankyrin repeat protein [Cotonvirus japonicus]BCS82514.1 ankyrin repeat protein [Cotonvirus japonicus]